MNEKRVQWRYLLEAIGAISIVASLLFVGLELRQAERATNNDRTISRVSLGISARDSINQYPDIWIRGNRGDELDEADYLIYSNLIENRAMEVDAIGLTALSLGGDVSNNLGVMGFSAFLFQNPGALKVWKENWDRYSAERALISGDPERSSTVRQAILQHIEFLESNSEN